MQKKTALTMKRILAAAVTTTVIAFSSSCTKPDSESIAKAEGKNVPQQIIKLKDKEWAIRFEAAKALGETKNASAAAALIEALNDSDEDVRAKAAESLGKIGNPMAIAGLSGKLEDASPIVRYKAAEALMKFGSDKIDIEKKVLCLLILDRIKKDHGIVSEKGFVFALIGASKKKEYENRAILDLCAIAEKYPADPEVRAAAPYLVEALNKKSLEDKANIIGALYAILEKNPGDPDITAAAPILIKQNMQVGQTVGLLAKIGLPAAPFLIGAVKDKDWNESALVRRALSMMGDPVIPVLTLALNSNDYLTLTSIVESIGDIGTPMAVAALIDVWKNTQIDEFIRGCAIEELGKIAEKNPNANLKSVFTKALDDRSSKVREAAIRTLGRTQDKSVVPLIAKALYDKSDDVREAAADTLVDFGKMSAPAAPMLSYALWDRVPEVRKSAASLLGEIGYPSSIPLLLQAFRSRDKLNIQYGVDWDAAHAIAKINGGVFVLIGELGSGSWRVRGIAGEALGELGVKAAPALPMMRMILKEAESLDSRNIKVKDSDYWWAPHKIGEGMGKIEDDLSNSKR